jgi:hypothetical protein
MYLSALVAAEAMGRSLGEATSKYHLLKVRGTEFLECRAFNGEYFYQVKSSGLRAADTTLSGLSNVEVSDEARGLIQKEGPKYQYGAGCLSDGMLGAWLAWASGLNSPLSYEKITSHLKCVHKNNHKGDLSGTANPQRPKYAVAGEGGLLLCSWPRGGEPSLPFVYSNEVWTGIEHQVASHMISMGLVEQGLEITRSCRSRYDGRVRNPFNEYECGHWYARAMASFTLVGCNHGCSL